MEIYTIGFTKKSAEEFFEILKQNGIKCLIDVRLHNQSQLAGFAKRNDLKYFLRELCGTEYQHEPRLAPTEEILEDYRHKKIGWEEYRQRFLKLLADRKVAEFLPRQLFETPTVLLCSESQAEYCHRRLVAEYLQRVWGDVVIRDL
ncbi:DUF488 domain-containing protein [Desulfobacca acetoxidans]|uniref:DUF488 domain-containing protein n=1 Tax=Desulfobacca acetoxidans (strain ATCC 700848 / DSM 11109 / ASRB2) TaxID=880072 RepID=F2NDE0_DESAR|nr:DUF488 domain-containing protein [Desulfobacca acetoxidans]AEB10006.1 hypothetical protein Desac_2177 [Desulfobacca acetoxidans DSM 11109]